jgi:hypothetical protein
MKLIFERETELGRCDADRLCSQPGDWDGEWLAFALTTAALTRNSGMLRIEQRCYLRPTNCSDDLRNQTWVKPEMMLEPVPDGKEATLEMVQQLHDDFVAKARQEFMDQSIVSPVATSPASDA